MERQYCPIPICDVSDELNRIYINNPHNSYQKTLLWDIANATHLILSPILLIFGTILNILSIAVFTRPSLRKSATSFILVCLAITDTLALQMSALPRWLRLITGWKLETHSDLGCQVFYYMHAVVMSMSSWFLVVIAVERMVAVLKPHQAKIIFSRNNVCVVCVCILIGLFLINIPMLLGMQSISEFIFDNNDVHFSVFTNCWYCCLVNNSYVRLMFALSNLLIPFVTILIANSIVAFHVMKGHKKRQLMCASTNAQPDASKLHSLTRVLLTVTFSYLLFTLPFLLYGLVEPFTKRLYSSFEEARSAQQLWFIISTSFFNMNNSVNFLLYCIGGKQFRKVFLLMLGCAPNKVTPDTNVVI